MTAAREGSSDATGLPPVAATPQNGPAGKADVPGGRAHAGPQPVFIHSGDNMHREVD
ncbi:hypothetical protein NtRootA9_34730 [Arthrobacter sp. NtRootA9]|nr:hypothetical protein NtRootA9_34730 [Arthrobacter sp. NtRootA9]